MFYSSYGSFIHKLIERFYRGKITKEQMLTEFLTGFSNKVLGERPSESIVQKYIKCGVDYLKSFEPFPYKMIDVEKRVEFDIDGKKFVGVIDYIGEDNGDIYIVDNKSRDLKPRSNRKSPTQKDAELDEMLRQLYIYSVAVKNEYGKYPKSLCFNCFKSGVFIEEPFSMQAFEEALRWAKRSINEITEENDFPPNIDFFSCKYLCGFQDQCCYAEVGGSNSKSRRY